MTAHQVLATTIAISNLLSQDELAAFHRFCECCEDFDSGGYDVEKEMMAQLARIGVVRSTGFGRFETTKFGDIIRNGSDTSQGGTTNGDDEKIQQLNDLSRYEPTVVPFGYDFVAEMPEKEGGEWVKFSDVEELLEHFKSAPQKKNNIQGKDVVTQDELDIRAHAYADRIKAIASKERISNEDKHRLFEIALSVSLFADPRVRAIIDSSIISSTPENVASGNMSDPQNQENPVIAAINRRSEEIQGRREQVRKMVATAFKQHIPGNFTTHRDSWRDAITECINFEIAKGNSDQAAYWEHELAAYDRSFSRLLDNPEFNMTVEIDSDARPSKYDALPPPKVQAALDKHLAADGADDQISQDLEQLMIEHRIGLTPENEGGFHAFVYADQELFTAKGYGNTPSEAVRAAMSVLDAPSEKGNE